jgi:hypothetical protein
MLVCGVILTLSVAKGKDLVAQSLSQTHEKTRQMAGFL